jgi:malate synthase
VLPDRNAVTMTAPFMRAYTELLVKTCHVRGAHAMGGMWLHNDITLAEGPTVNKELVEQIIGEELATIKAQLGAAYDAPLSAGRQPFQGGRTRR